MENGTTIIHYSEVQFSEVLYICSCLAHFPPAESPKKKKIKKNPPRKEFLIFEEMKLSSCNIKKILYFRKWNPALLSPRQKKKNPSRNWFLTFPEMELSSSNNKRILCFLKRKLFLYFQKWNPALFSPSSKNKKIQ